MPPETTEAASPASAPAVQTGDARKGTGNLSLSMATQQLVARAAEAANAKPAPTATEETAPVAPVDMDATPEEAPVAEVETTSDEPKPEETATPAETETTGEEEPKAEADSDVLSPKSSLDPKAKAAIQKRIDREVAKRKDMERAHASELATLKAQVNELAQQQSTAQVPAQPLPAMGNNPFANITDPGALAKAKQEAKDAIRFTEQLLESPGDWQQRQDPKTGADVRYVKVGDQEWTEGDLRRAKWAAKVALEDHLPQREQFLAVKAQAGQRAVQRFPFLTDRTSPDYALAQGIRKNNPWLDGLPNADEVIAVQVRGIRGLEADERAAAEAKSKAAEKPKPKAAPPKPSSDQAVVSTTATATRAPISTGVKQAIVAEQKKTAEKRGITAEEAKASLLKLSRLRNSR